MNPSEVFISFGSNLGDRESNIRQAIDLLKNIPEISVEKVSSIIETEPCGGPYQGKYLNGAIKLKTSLEPQELLKALQSSNNRKECYWCKEIRSIRCSIIKDRS